MSDVSHHPGEERELARTASYMVFSRRRGTALYAQLLVNRRYIERLERSNDYLRERADSESNLLVHALHELAVTRKEKEPQLFIRRWLSDHRDVSADANERRSRLLG